MTGLNWQLGKQVVRVIYFVGMASTYDIGQALEWRKAYPSLGLRAEVVAGTK
jgi:hypothetical protein